MIKHGSVMKTIRRIQARYEIRFPKRTVQTNYAEWWGHATVQNLNKENSGHIKHGGHLCSLRTFPR